MRKFTKCVAQGDVMFRKVEALPKTVTKRKDKIVAHSETGHHHSFDQGASVWLYSTPDDMVSYMEVKKPAVLKHRRDFDTHEEILFDSGFYEIRRQREGSVEDWKKVVD